MKRGTFGEVLGQSQPYSSREQIVKNTIPEILRILHINRLKLVRVKRILEISALLGLTRHCTQDKHGNHSRRRPYQDCSHLRPGAHCHSIQNSTIPMQYAALPKPHVAPHHKKRLGSWAGLRFWRTFIVSGGATKFWAASSASSGANTKQQMLWSRFAMTSIDTPKPRSCARQKKRSAVD